jgi:hypothetical protein
MNQVPQIALVLILGAFSLNVMGRLVLRWSARRRIHQAFEKDGASIARIRRFDGFLDLGSVVDAATSTGYIVTLVTRDGRKSDRHCLVRYIPIVGFARNVEVLFEDTNVAP